MALLSLPVSLLAAVLWCGLCASIRGQSPSDDFRCDSAGYHEDPDNCSVFYRCVSFWGRSRLRRVKFACKEPTVYDADLRVCQFPWRLKPPCVKNANGIWVRENRLPTVLPPADAALPNITVLELGSPDYVTSPPPRYQVAAGSPFACPGPGEYFADVPDTCVFYYECAETGPGVLNAELRRCPPGEIFTASSGGCLRPLPLPPCGDPDPETLLSAGDLPPPPGPGPSQYSAQDDSDFYLELEFRK